MLFYYMLHIIYYLLTYYMRSIQQLYIIYIIYINILRLQLYWSYVNCLRIINVYQAANTKVRLRVWSTTWNLYLWFTHRAYLAEMFAAEKHFRGSARMKNARRK